MTVVTITLRRNTAKFVDWFVKACAVSNVLFKHKGDGVYKIGGTWAAVVTIITRFHTNPKWRP